MKFPVSDIESPKLYIAVMPSTVLGADDGAGEGGSGLPRQPTRRRKATRNRRRPFAAIAAPLLLAL
jgi:hypothetical protein